MKGTNRTFKTVIIKADNPPYIQRIAQAAAERLAKGGINDKQTAST